MTPTRGFITRCCICRHSIEGGKRVSKRPLSDGEWDYLGNLNDISDGLCEICAPGERARLLGEVNNQPTAQAVMQG